MTPIEQAIRRLEEKVARLEAAALLVDQIEHNGHADHQEAERAESVAARLDAVIGRLDRVLEG